MRNEISCVFMIVAVLVFIAIPSLAKDSISGIDGATILNACKDTESKEGQMLCSAYIAGFKDTVVGMKMAYKNSGDEIRPLYCLPEKGVSHDTLIKIVISSIEEQIRTDPKVGKVNASTLILFGLYKKYPC